ncbi:MAG: Nif11-like leader peptide family RiPP precursor [Eubacteriales bacterium]|nr:Nif11-like leader peptide family RiPP precursor [Eubacteriales bacterium]MDD3199144.1 Nif11-like leader peptide family RiPP precursor [Eubacteriales bacterium]MDD4122495.1 Nif11-like leader peptide family RiPP precursor [Eubacteriales bacterium]MDD4629201.1 Nif11-like leader peptide family RiPP precursor [Eubacteriales bacterium]
MADNEQLKALYEKVSKDTELQKKFIEIMVSSSEENSETTRDKLIKFAQDAGYDVSVNEIQEFLKDMATEKEGELNLAELDMVAGGKGEGIGMAVIGGISSALTAIILLGMTLPACIGQIQHGIVMEQFLNR